MSKKILTEAKKVKHLSASADITSWLKAVTDANLVIRNNQDIIDMIAEGLPTTLVGKAAMVYRELGIADEDILPPNDLLLNLACRHSVSLKINQLKREEQFDEGGKVYNVRRFIGRPTRLGDGDDNSQDSYVSTDSNIAVEYVMEYLQKKFMGHVWNRFLILHSNGVDIENVANLLKNMIDDIVDEILE